MIDKKPVPFEIDGKAFHCALDITMHFIGGKWKTVVLWYLIDGKKRFNELRKLIPDITERMLSIQLQQLETDGIIKREQFNKKPPFKVEYSFTTFGETLKPTIEIIAHWGREIYFGNIKRGF